MDALAYLLWMAKKVGPAIASIYIYTYSRSPVFRPQLWFDGSYFVAMLIHFERFLIVSPKEVLQACKRSKMGSHSAFRDGQQCTIVLKKGFDEKK